MLETDLKITNVIICFFVLVAFTSCDQKILKKTNELNQASSIPNIDRASEVSELPPGLNESSGIIKTDSGTLLSHNDSGGKSRLFEFALNGELVGHYDIDTKNFDWEEIASDSNFIYIGDFGNNAGNRKNLVVYKVSKKDMTRDEKLDVERIEFNYPEQTKFGHNDRHNFDCEAMIAWNKNLYLFTKNRGDQKSSLYKIPAVPGIHNALFISTFDTKGLITGADINQSERQIALIGYNYVGISGFEPFIWTFTDFKKDDFFTGKPLRIDFPFNRQTEAICYQNDTTLLFTEEEEYASKSYLYKLNVK